MHKKINLIFMGGFTYPHGMASTRRIQNIINALKEQPCIETQVILQRQSTEENTLSGVYEGTPYQTIMGNLFRVKMLLALPILYYKTIVALKNAKRQDYENIIYFYGSIFFDSILPLKYSQKIGYKIIFDVVEDFGLAKEVSHSIYQHAKNSLANRLSLQIKNMATGIVVISSYLEDKSRLLTDGRVPIHYMPISVDMTLFPDKSYKNTTRKTLFYAGSFGKKDGMLVLLEAFDKLAESYDNIVLILTGRGDSDSMKEFFSRVEASPYKNRIDYRGYMDEEEYYSLLNDIDIPCMTRVDLAFAHAGFPFKLGEFLATGRPVIASKVSDVERFLVNQHNAMLVQAGSSEEICDAAEFLLANLNYAKAIGKRGREVASTCFNHKQQGDDLLIFLQNL